MGTYGKTIKEIAEEIGVFKTGNTPKKGEKNHCQLIYNCLRQSLTV